MHAPKMTDESFLSDPGMWPYWPILPVVARSAHDLTCGVIFADKLTRVYLTNMLSLSERTPRPLTWANALEGVPTREYDSVGKLLEEWRID